MKYPCKEGDYQAIQKWHFIQHKESAHKGIKYPCKECNYQVTSQGYLMWHQTSDQEGIKYLCKECNDATEKGFPIRHQSFFSFGPGIGEYT